MDMTEPRTKPKAPLLQPLTIRGLTLKNRVMSTSHASGMDDENMPGLRYQRYHEEKAKSTGSSFAARKTLPFIK